MPRYVFVYRLELFMSSLRWVWLKKFLFIRFEQSRALRGTIEYMRFNAMYLGGRLYYWKGTRVPNLVTLNINSGSEVLGAVVNFAHNTTMDLNGVGVRADSDFNISLLQICYRLIGVCQNKFLTIQWIHMIDRLHSFDGNNKVWTKYELTLNVH